MFERFDQRANKVIKAAFAEAAMLGDDAVCTEHILLALATVDSVTARVLTAAGGSPASRPPGAPGDARRRPRRDSPPGRGDLRCRSDHPGRMASPTAPASPAALELDLLQQALVGGM
jgi:hypothetical protein